MWWYKILGDNGVSISHLIWFDPITEGCFLLTSRIIFTKRENHEPIITVKRIEWSKFIEYFGLSIGDKPSRVGKNNVYFPYLVYTPIPSSGQLCI